jgi:dipeptidyl-peptidase 4
MKIKHIILLLFVQIAVQQVGFAQSKITIEDIWQNYKFTPKGAAGFDFMRDGKRFLKVDADRATGIMALNAYNIADGKMTETLLNSNDIKAEWSSYALNSDETDILYATDDEPLYRHSSKSNFYTYNIKNKSVAALSAGGKQRLATFNPQGDKIAFIRDNNLYYKDLKTNKETQITVDGVANSIINGAADWVYEEEFSMDRAFYWSPDGKSIGFIRFDESAVRQVTLTLYSKQIYPEYSSFKYPKAGEKNATVSAHVYNVENNKITNVILPADVTAKEFYIPKIQFTNDNRLAVLTLNRLQNDLKGYIFEEKTAVCTPFLMEKSETYVDIAPGTSVANNLFFLKDNQHYLWLSERDGYNHLYKGNIKTGVATPITKGKFDVTTFYGIDEKNNILYYQAAEKAAYDRQIYCIGLDGKGKKTMADADGWNDAEFSKTFDFYILNHSTLNSPPEIAVFDNKNKKQRDLETNESLKKIVANCDIAKAEFFNFKTSEDVTLNGWMIKPKDFDAKKKYPVLMHVYGGPASQEADNRWDAYNYWWHQHLAQQGYIVVTIDGRGTGARGSEFKKCTYKQLGKLETMDQIEGAKWLGKQSFVDASRIGIWGWSYGGYMSLLAILKGSNVFKAAIAVAPVTNWKWYDSIYTERFLATPQENEKGYEDNSPINFAKNLKGNLLLIHGDADDNVHYQNSAEMAAALIAANKQFDTYVYPNKNHGIYGGATRLHLYTKMTNFIKEKL